MSRNVTVPREEDHGMSRNVTVPREEDHGMSRNVTVPREEDHGMSRNVTVPREEDHGMSRNVTVSESEGDAAARPYFERLSASKQAAIRHLVEGASLAEAARRVGVRRETVSRWLNHDYLFEMALREKLRETWAEVTVGMATHARDAIQMLVEALECNTFVYRMRAAKDILALTPLARGNSPVGPYLPFGP